MSIKPIDIKTMIPKTQQISKIQQAENDKNNNLSQIQNANQMKVFEKELKTVKNTEKAYKTKITKDNSHSNKKGGNKDSRNSDSSKKRSDNKTVINSLLGTNIDIKI